MVVAVGLEEVIEVVEGVVDLAEEGVVIVEDSVDEEVLGGIWEVEEDLVEVIVEDSVDEADLGGIEEVSEVVEDEVLLLLTQEKVAASTVVHLLKTKKFLSINLR
jgi:hypothetical protein